MLAPLKKSYDQPVKSILKSRDITLLIKVRVVKAIDFPVVTYGCDHKVSTEELMLLNCDAGEDS